MITPEQFIERCRDAFALSLEIQWKLSRAEDEMKERLHSGYSAHERYAAAQLNEALERLVICLDDVKSLSTETVDFTSIPQE